MMSAERQLLAFVATALAVRRTRAAARDGERLLAGADGQDSLL